MTAFWTSELHSFAFAASSGGSASRTCAARHWVHERRRHVELRQQLGEEEPRVLEAADRLAERAASAHVLERQLERHPRVGEVQEGRAEPLLGQVAHHVREPLAHLPDDVGVGHAHVVEEQLRGVGFVLPDLVELAPAGEPGHPVLEGEQRDVLLAGSRRDDDEPRLAAVGDERLGAADEQSPSCRRADVASARRSEPAPGSVIRWR